MLIVLSLILQKHKKKQQTDPNFIGGILAMQQTDVYGQCFVDPSIYFHRFNLTICSNSLASVRGNGVSKNPSHIRLSNSEGKV